MEGSQVRPSLDHFVGQPAKSIKNFGKENWQWGVVMEDGSVFRNHDKRRTAAPGNELVGQTMGAVIHNELDTRVTFGNGGELVFTPQQYSISQKGSKDEFFPHMVDEEERIVPVPWTPELEARVAKKVKKGSDDEQTG